jgi:hypothetical protein
MEAKAASLPKNMWVGFVLNLLIPGAGYLYYRRFGLAVAAFFIILPVLIILSAFTYGAAWICWALVMGLDMRKFQHAHQQALLVATTKKCPNCAELVQREARVCRFCQTKFSDVDTSA